MNKSPIYSHNADNGPATRMTIAIISTVIDVLNMDESMAHHQTAYEGITEGIYGGYAADVGDYVDENVLDRFDTPRGQELLEIIDPYEYRDRLDLPKYLVNSTGDEFFVPDSSQFYFDGLIGDKYLRYVPNSGHSLPDEANEDAAEFLRAVARGDDLPEFSWAISEGGSKITVDTVDAPLAVKVWQATNPENRDFRIYTFGQQWTDSTLADQGGGQYVADLEFPETGATAFMVELEYLVGDKSIKFTTEVSVIIDPPLNNADFNGNGSVDGGDFLAWQTGFGGPGTHEEGDTNGDGQVDGDDLLLWQTQFCGPPPSGALLAVPEPASFAMLAVMALAVASMRKQLG